MNDKNKLLRNIPLLYAIKIAKWFSLIMPIVVLFYEDNSLGMQDIFILKSIYSVAVVILEIPSGFLSDVWGRKKTLILGSILGTLGFLIYSLSDGFWQFAAAEIVLGVGVSFISGSDSALLYDSLYCSNNSNKYSKIEGRITSIGNLAEAIAGILGALIATYSLRFPFIGQTMIAFIGIPASIMLTEPKINNKIARYNFIDILKVVKFSMVDNKKLKWNIIYSSLIGCSTLTMAWFIQKYLILFDTPRAYYGYIWASLNITVAMVSFQAYKFDKKFGQIKTVMFILIGIASGYILTGIFSTISIFGMAFVYMFYIIRGVATPVLKDYINRITDSHIRSTVLSVRNFIIRLIFAIIGPFVGWLNDICSFKVAMLSAASIFFVVGAISIIGINKYNKLPKSEV